MSSVDKLIRVHIKIDTGMSRMGCSINDFDKIFNIRSSNAKLAIATVIKKIPRRFSKFSPYFS